MWGRLLKRQPPSPRRLSKDDVRRLAREFVNEWDPFRQRYGQAGDVLVEPIADAEQQQWAATVVPARDVRCGLVIADGTGQVVEARLVAMRPGTVLAEWHSPAPPTDDAPRR
jgi:hypothetical protein